MNPKRMRIIRDARVITRPVVEIAMPDGTFQHRPWGRSTPPACATAVRLVDFTYAIALWTEPPADGGAFGPLPVRILPIRRM